MRAHRLLPTILLTAILVLTASTASQAQRSASGHGDHFVKFFTKNLDQEAYRTLIRRYIVGQFGPDAYRKISQEWEFNIHPVEAGEKHMRLNDTVKEKMGEGIPWGYMHPASVTSNKKGKGQLWAFLPDSRGANFIRMNADKLLHEVCHVAAYIKYGTVHVVRQFSDPQMEAGTSGPAFSVLVHDVYYGTKKYFRFEIPYENYTVPVMGLDLSGVFIQIAEKQPEKRPDK